MCMNTTLSVPVTPIRYSLVVNIHCSFPSNAPFPRRRHRYRKNRFSMRKSTRLSSIGLAAAAEVREPPVRNFRTRFSLTPFAKRVQQLTEEQRSVISKTGFGNLLLIPNHSLSKILLTELMEIWNCQKQAFVLDSGEIRMTLLDAALILGLRVVGKPVVLREEEPFSELEEFYGASKGKRKVELGSLDKRLDSIGGVATDEFVRTFLLYTIGTFLSSNGKVDSRYLAFLQDLDEVGEFAWGAAVVEDLAQWLDKRKENNVQYVGGCLIFLQTWSYEHFDIARPQLQGHDLTFPRVCRWDNGKSHQRQRLTSRFKDLNDDQVIWKLQPTSGELQIEIIKEVLEVLSDSRELQSAENCSTSTSSNVQDADSESQLSISSKEHREDEFNFENQVVEDTPTKLSACSGEYREREINRENLIVEDTPPKLRSCNGEYIEQEIDPENLIVDDTPPKLSTCNGEYGDQETNLENLIVEDTPSNSSNCGEVHRQLEMSLVNLIVEDTPTSLSTADEVRREQEFNAEELRVDDTPQKSSCCEDDLRQENVKLKMKIGQVMEENELLHRQILSNKEFEEQNTELKKELEILREENTMLRLSLSRYLDRMDRHILDFETNASEI